MRHPENEQLLRYADGELPARTAGKIRSHVGACWQCRVELDELEETISECVRYRKNILQPYLPSPPAPWFDIYQGFARIDASSEPDFFYRARQRVIRAMQVPAFGVKGWAAAAVVLMVVVGLLYRFGQAPAVEASELLQKAVAAATAQPAKPRVIQIRTRQHRVTRLAGTKTATTADANELQALFLAAKFDWDDPLSARSYQAWRNQLTDKKDEVTREHDAYRVRTSTASNELMTATLTLSTPDLRPVEERLEFRNREWVEITEVAPETIAPPTAVTGKEPVSISPPNPASLPAPALSATIGDELHVVAALHQAGADLGDPIEVTRGGGNVLVTGIGVAPQRQQEIHDVLASNPRVIVRFTDAAAPSIQPEKAVPAETSAGGDLRQLQARMAEHVGGRVQFDQLAAQVLDSSESMMSRAYALRRLAERFPIETESQLTAPDLRLLRSLRLDHTAAFKQQIAEIDRTVRAVLPAANGAASQTPGTLPRLGAWQPATEDLFQSARHVEKLLAVVFGAAQGESSDAQLPSQLLSSLAELRARSEAYDHIATAAPDRSDR